MLRNKWLQKLLAAVAIGGMLTPAPAQIIHVDWIGGGADDDWNNAANWTPAMVPDNDTMNTFNVTTDNASIDLNADVTITDFTFNTGSAGSSLQIAGSAELLVEGRAMIDIGTLIGGKVNILDASTVARSLIIDGCELSTNGLTLGAGAGNSVVQIFGGGSIADGGDLVLSQNDTISLNGGTLIVGGNLIKRGTTGLASISGAGVAAIGGANIAVETGTLQIDQLDLFGSSIFVFDDQTLRIGVNGGTTKTSGLVAIDTMTSGTATFSGGTVETDGTLSSSGTGDLQFTNGVEITGLGAINGSAACPAQMINARIGDPNSGSGVENQGFMDLGTVTIQDRGLKNTSAGTLRITNGQTGSVIVRSGDLTNDGTVTHERTLTIDAGGKVRNQQTWNNNGANIIGTSGAGGGATSGRFINTGTFKVDGGVTPAFTQVTAPFQCTSGGTIDIDKGEMRLGGSDPNTTRLTGCFIDVNGPNNIFSYGLNGTSRSTSENVSFVLSNRAQARFFSGIHQTRGQMTSGGTGTVFIGNATLRATQPTTLRFASAAPLLLNNVNANIDCQAQIENADSIEALQGAIIGTAEFINKRNATFEVSDLLRVSRGSGGTLRNQGNLRITGLNFDGITVDANGSILNDPNGVIDIAGDAEIARQSASGTGELINKGLIHKSSGNGEALLSTGIYRQEDGGVLRATAGSIRLIPDLIEFLGGRIEAKGPTAQVRIADSSLIQDITCSFSDDAIIDVAGAANDLHEISGTLSGTGQGAMVHSNGTMRPRDLSATFDFGEDPNNAAAGSAEFRQTSGTLGETGSNLINRGNFRMTGGTIVGEFDNITTGAFNLDGGTVQGTFRNSADFTWSGGTIDAQFSTSATDPTQTEITANTGVLLASNATLTNTGNIEHSGGGALEIGTDAEVRNQSGGSYVFTGGANIVRPGSGVENAKFIHAGRLANEGPTNVSINVRFESTGGSIEADAGPITINGVIGQQDGQPTITGGTLVSTGPTAALTTASGDLRGNITHELGAEGLITHSLANIDATLTATGNGTVDLNGITADGTTFQLVGAAASTFAFRGNNSCGATGASTGGSLTFTQARFDLFGNGSPGSFDATSEVLIDSVGSASTSFRGLDSGTRATFTSNQTTLQQGTADLLFDGAIQFNNVGTYQLAGDSGMTAADASDNDILFENTGTFEKNDGLSSGFSTISIPFRNTGTVKANKGNLRIQPFCQSLSGSHLLEGTWEVDPNASLSLNNAITITENDGTIRIKGNGDFKNLPNGATTTMFQNDGTLCLETGATFQTSGEFENNGTTKIASNSTLSVGEIDNDNDLTVDGTLTFASASRWQSGTIRGTGVVNGTTLTSSARTAPGQSPGTLTINADFQQDPNGVLEIELAGTTVDSEHDLLIVQGNLSLDGTLDLVLLDGFVPASSDTFAIVSANSLNGAFANAPRDPNDSGIVPFADGSFQVDYLPNGIVLSNYQPNCTGDTNNDLLVDLTDLANVLSAFGTTSGTSGYLPGADLDGDGDVDLTDLSTVLALFGTGC